MSYTLFSRPVNFCIFKTHLLKPHTDHPHRSIKTTVMLKSLLVIIAGTWISGLFLPWWTLIFPCFIAGFLFADKGYKAFSAGLGGVGGLWLTLALWADVQNGGIMSAQVGAIMQLSTMWLYVITWAIGGITGGLACIGGFLISRLRA